MYVQQGVAGHLKSGVWIDGLAGICTSGSVPVSISPLCSYCKKKIINDLLADTKTGTIWPHSAALVVQFASSAARNSCTVWNFWRLISWVRNWWTHRMYDIWVLIGVDSSVLPLLREENLSWLVSKHINRDHRASKRHAQDSIYMWKSADCIETMDLPGA